MNDSKYGLTASVWTRDEQAFEFLVDKIEAGTVFQNRCDYLDPALAWTGVKHSGRGVSLGKYGEYVDPAHDMPYSITV
jgi:acyl-CoA reductase-like NAD-dependent aldehyde dehydrogenase